MGTRTEVKNIFSVRAVAKAVAYEIERQKAAKDRGETIVNETRSWDAISGKTIPMRDKEVVQDYRFMPEPNLPPLHLDMTGTTQVERVNVPRLKDNLPKLPQQIREYLTKEKQLSEAVTVVLVNDQTLMKYFNKISENFNVSPKIIANILVTELLAVCKKHKVEIEDCAISAEDLGELVDMLAKEEVNMLLVSLILNEMMETSKPPRAIADERNWKLTSDEAEITKICEEVLATESGQSMAKAYKSGKTRVLLAINKAIIDRSNSTVNMKIVQVILKKLLEK